MLTHAKGLIAGVQRVTAGMGMRNGTGIWLGVGNRAYAADVKAAKTGQKKVATKDEDAGEALPPYYPRPTTHKQRLRLQPRHHRVTYVDDPELPADPRAKLYGHRLLRAVDKDLRARALPEDHAADNRVALFAKGGPEAVEPGSVLLVEQLSSRSSPRKLAFAGVLLNINRRGILSSFTLRNYVLGSAVELVFPIYSPMVSRIKVLKRVNPGFASGSDQVNYLRRNPAAAPLSFGAPIDELVLRNSETERKRSQIRTQQNLNNQLLSKK
ncbi:hypothetical protein HK100_000317 [Physocladia obscura]|uniref:Ribosomal protein L19 n=1 Tax=Physocladia obscura TaxID=109957 RepID=A0AAD5SYU3_9FUNG|nr:hypothetical protein HK100_000317 [Physocladia obscura]